MDRSPFISGFKDGWHTFLSSSVRMTIGERRTLEEFVRRFPYAPIHKNLPGYWEGHHVGEEVALHLWNWIGLIEKQAALRK